MLNEKLASVEQFLETGWRERRDGDHLAALAAFEAAASLNPDRPGIKVELAHELRILDRLEGAEDVLSAILAIEPNNADALIEHAHLLRRRSDHSRAAASFQAAASIAPRNVPLRLELIRELRAIDLPDRAEEELRELLRIDPGNIGASIERGHLRRRRGDHVGAAMAFAAAAAADARNQDVRLEFARELRAADCLDEAEAVLCAMLEASPRCCGALVERAYLSRQRGDRARAVANFEEAANAVAPDDANAVDVWLELAAELADLGRFGEALHLIRSLTEKYSDHPLAWLQLGQILRIVGDRAKALESFRVAVDRKPDHVRALVELAREYWFAGSPKAAREALGRALFLAPDDFAGLIVAAEQALASQSMELALAFARNAIAHHPGQLTAYLVGARAAAQFDRAAAEALLAQARTAFGPLADIAAAQVHILRVHRDHEAARAAIAEAGAQVNAHAGLWSEAVSLAIATGEFEWAEGALAAPPDASATEAARVHALRGQLAQARRNCEQAVKHYEEALACGDLPAEWRAELAQCCLLLADVDDARTHLRASIDVAAAGRLASGRSVNVSQHHLGPLCDEFALDRPLLWRMKQIRALPPDDRIDLLSDLVRQYPDSTGPALMLLLAMRQAKALGSAPRELLSESDERIPKRIVQYWHDKEPPADVRELMASWRRAYPDYEYRLFDDEAALEFLRARAPNGATEAFLRVSDIPQRADILRLAYLAIEGGFFVDADDRRLAALSEDISASATFVGYQEQLGSLGANFIGAAGRHPVIIRAFSLAVEAVNRGDHDVVWLSTGPGLLTRAFAQTWAEPDSERWRSKAVVLESYELHRAVGVHCPANYKRNPLHSGFAALWGDSAALAPAGRANSGSG